MMLAMSLLAGLLFGAGMVISGMIDPARVLGFLDIMGQWDASLAWVMIGALVVFMPSYGLWLSQRKQSLLGEPMPMVPTPHIDKRLIGGAILFGVGWGWLGICPGPAISLIATGQSAILLFIFAMLLGMWLVGKWIRHQ